MKDEKKRLVVVGNGMAGAAALEEIIKLDPERYDITVFGKERHPNYNRVLLTELLMEEKSLSEITLNDESWYAERGIELCSGSAIVEIDRARRLVRTASGDETPYDTLILATGSVPFMPPIPGIDKEGVLTFRDIKDCESIRKRAESASGAVVVGGGLLGLEAARGLSALGMDVTVVHLMESLMERQLDSVAADYLREDLEELGIKVLLGKKTESLTGNGSVTGMDFSDGERLDAEMVVMAAGIRPNIELAQKSGIYCERGIVVGDTMQSFDPAIYAVGECTQNRGETFGLVAQVFDQARVVANHLAGDCRLSFKNRPVSTKLKIPGIALYSAGTISEGGDTIEYHDRGARVYKRLFIKEGRLDGIVMYGDVASGPTLFGRLIAGDDISARRMELLTGAGSGAGGSPIDAMTDETIICGCNGITKGMVVEAVKTKGLFTLDDVKRETKASTSCGGCSDVVERVLESVLGSSFKSETGERSICACTKYTRDDVIKNIREKELRTVGEVMETLGWETVGCDDCRPALNYYLGMIWPTAAVDDYSSRLVNERFHANIQKDETFSVVPRMYGGVATSDELRRIADVADNYDVPLIKITGGQRIDLLGIPRDKLRNVWKDLDMPSGFAYAKALRTVKTCVGSRFCRFGTQDSLSLGIDMEKALEGLWMPAKVKLGVTGCPRNCAEAPIKDVGVVCVNGGFEIYVGGCGGINTRAGDLMCTVESEEEVLEVTSAFLQLYREEANYGERTFKWIERTGLESVKKAVVGDIEERGELTSRMSIARSVTTDPWAERIA